MRLALADAFDLGRVQRVDLAAALVLALLAHPAGQHQRHGEDALEPLVAPDAAADVARHPAEIGAQRPQVNTVANKSENLLSCRVQFATLTAPDKIPVDGSMWTPLIGPLDAGG